MGLSASQARFLQLTARRSNIEYQAQQINQQRLQLASKLEMYSNEYQQKISNRKMVFKYNNGTGVQNVDVTYNNYKNIMNQQQAGITTTQARMFLVSSSGNKIVVANREDMKAMIDSISVTKPVTVDDGLQEIPDGAKVSEDGKTYTITTVDKDGKEITETKEITPKKTTYVPVENGLSEDDFLIVDNLDDPDAFQLAIQNGDYYFATMNEVQFDENGEPIISFKTDMWETIGGGAIQEEYDRADDAEAEATFSNKQTKIQKADKKLEMELNKLESERTAIQTEIDSVTKVIDDNIEKGFKAFS